MLLSSRLRLRTDDPGNIMWPYVGLLSEHLAKGRYRDKHQRKSIASALQFGDWLDTRNLVPASINEDCILRFLAEYSRGSSGKRRTPSSMMIMRAALNTLLRVLRSNNIVAVTTPSALDIELSAFSEMLNKVWGLSPTTCYHRCCAIRRLLSGRLTSGRSVLSVLTSSALREFVLGDQDRKPSTIRNAAAAVRCYLRYRALIGDDVRLLQRAVPTPSFRAPMNLPEALSSSELKDLLHLTSAEGRNRRRAHAIVRCLADLGMRSQEVVQLTLDDIDWENGLIRVPSSKSRRSDLMPLPAITGEAIVDYLAHERPATTRREIFVRHVAPIGEPVGRRVVQKTLHTAYLRLGWKRTRVHIFRHSIASKLVNDAVPLKQIADVMRHRSVVTTAGYARVDRARLSAVALPWPGERA